MNIKNILIKSWNSPRIRNIIVLSVLSLILLTIIIESLLSKEVPPPPGAKRAAICRNCKETVVQRIHKIKEGVCSNCQKKGTLNYAWKCGKCQYEYYPVPYKFKTKKLNTMQRFQKMEEARACPNCQEMKDIGPMATQHKK